jgi:hypothetical protein
MFELVVIVFLVAVGPLAVLYGVDSRLDEPRR